MDYDKIFGPHGERGWPGDVDEAKSFIDKVHSATSSSQCFEDDDFIHPYKLEEELWPETREEARAREEKRQELFNDAKDWPLASVVTSAVYKILTDKTERFGSVDNFTWFQLFWIFLLFKEQLFDMVESKKWASICRKEVREGFKQGLRWDTKNFRGDPIIWGDGWFRKSYVNSKIYPQDVLRCLRLAGVDKDVASLATNQVFKSQSLTPFYDALSDEVTITSIASILPSEKDQNSPHSEGKNIIESITALFSLTGFLFCLFYRRQSYIPIPVAKRQITIEQVVIEQNPCFAAIRMGEINTQQPREKNKDRSPTRWLYRSSPPHNSSPTHSSHRSSFSQPHEDHFVTRSSFSLSPQRKRIPDLQISTAEKVKTLTKGMFGMEDSAARIVKTKLKWQTIQGQVVVSRKEQQNEKTEVGSSKESEIRGKKLRLISRLRLRRLMSRLRHLKSNKIAARQKLASHRILYVSQEEGETSDRPLNRLSTSLSTRISKRLSDLHKKFTLQGEKVGRWISKEKIITEDSPEIKEMRENARKAGREIPRGTVFCVHLEKYGQNQVIARTQGTVMQYSSHDDIQQILKKDLNIEGREVLFPTGGKV